MTDAEQNDTQERRVPSIFTDHVHQMMRESLRRQEKRQQALIRLWKALRADDMDAVRRHATEVCRLSKLQVKEPEKKGSGKKRTRPETREDG
ncbi:MAG: hypothetical protein HYY66_01410 [Candidatus Tectomicrobia bacterium]|nr:hypothetical protein [Candidatus Tectomicrobia bacterium]